MLHFCWISLGGSHSNIFTFLSTPSLQIRLNSFLGAYSCDFGNGYGFAWCGFASCCSYMSTGLALQVPKVPSNIKSCLVNIVCSSKHSFSGRNLLSYVTLRRYYFL